MPNKTLADLKNEAQSFHAFLKKRNGKGALLIFRKFQKISKRKNADQWESLFNHTAPGKPRLSGSSIIKTLRKFLTEQQNDRCCYCRCALQNIAYAKPVEHILPRASYPGHSVIFYNLAVACFDCNQIKDARNWSSLKPRSRKILHNGIELDFYHPRLHNYSKHVDFITYEDGNTHISLYVGRTKPGMYLCSNLLASVSQKRIFLSGDSSLKKSLGILENLIQDKNSDDISEIRDFYRSLISGYVIKQQTAGS